MAKKPKPYEPPTYGMRSLAIERRLAGKPPADMRGDEEAPAPVEEKAEGPAPENKAIIGAAENKSDERPTLSALSTSAKPKRK